MDSTHDCKSYQEVDMKKQSLFVTHKSTEKRLFMIINVVDLFCRRNWEIVNQKDYKLHQSSCILFIDSAILITICIYLLHIRKLNQICKILIYDNSIF